MSDGFDAVLGEKLVNQVDFEQMMVLGPHLFKHFDELVLRKRIFVDEVQIRKRLDLWVIFTQILIYCTHICSLSALAGIVFLRLLIPDHLLCFLFVQNYMTVADGLIASGNVEKSGIAGGLLQLLFF